MSMTVIWSSDPGVMAGTGAVQPTSANLGLTAPDAAVLAVGAPVGLPTVQVGLTPDSARELRDALDIWLEFA